MSRLDVVREAYVAFNGRDIDAALAQMTEDVDWPNAWEGGRVVGHDAVRSYWTRQWAEIDSRADPVVLQERPDGTVVVDVHLLVRSHDGEVLDERHVVHVFTFKDDLVARMDVSEA